MQAAAWTPGARRTRHPPQHSLTAIIDSQFGLREHPGMTDSKDDTAVLTTALNRLMGLVRRAHEVRPPSDQLLHSGDRTPGGISL